MSDPTAGSFTLSPNQDFKEQMVKREEPEEEDLPDSLEEICKTVFVSSGRRFNLTLCESFSFELKDNKVHVIGFDTEFQDIPTSRTNRFVGVPATPATMVAPDRESFDLGERKRLCNCKKSRCLKLYCECFAAGLMCDGCKCMDCANDGNHEAERAQAVDAIKLRNQNAFAPKIVDEIQQMTGSMHARGCRCKKSHCLKKYCECFQARVQCTDKCKCEECKNFDSTPRERDGFRPIATTSSRASVSSGKRWPGEGGFLSPLARSTKKPRVLDFNVATPRMPAPQTHADQDSDAFSDDGSQARDMFGGAGAFGSPASAFLRMSAA